MQGPRMNAKLRKALILAIALTIAGCEKHPAQSAFELDPIVHPASGRIVFSRLCADENPYSVQAYARMASRDGRAQAAVAYHAGYRATGGKTVYIDLRLQRLKLSAGAGWENAAYSIRLIGRSGQRVVEGPKVRHYIHDADGREPVRRNFRTDATGTADWITFIESEDRREGADRFYRMGPELHFKTQDLQVDSPKQEIELTLALENEAAGETLALQGPRLRVPERLWAMTPPTPRALGVVQTLNPLQEGGLFNTLGRAWKYRKCIEERRAAKRALGPYVWERLGESE